MIQEAWQESLLPQVEEDVNGEVDLGPPLDKSTIHWRPSEDGVVFLEFFWRDWQLLGSDFASRTQS